MFNLNSQCQNCRHFRNDLTCAAFPDGIPSVMIAVDLDEGEIFDHRKPYAGDHGVQFEPATGKHHPLEVLNGR